MYRSVNPSTPATLPRGLRPGSLPWRRRPATWIAVWALYSLLALGYFAYRDAWLGNICIGPQ
ncbi:MAG: hypothetical protein CVU34_08715 [Betaproteobacteria bacterium HGW-Betaproteobacteria-7]|nr:MAG: hypothetical protein CVU34_08715 [Betaproteobacteria bacterium HGW-Betaproteobacteria-7]